MTRPRIARRFVTLVLVSAVTLAGFSARPAAAGGDLEKLLFGAATLFIIGTAIENHKKREDKKRDDRKRETPTRPVVVHRATLPEYCLRTVRAQRGPRLIYDRRCLRDNYRDFAALPRECRVEINGPNGQRRGFRTGCLYRAGFPG